MFIIEIFEILLLFSAFASIHFYLASEKIIKTLSDKYGKRMAFYRFFYNLIAITTFYLYIEFSPKPDIIIFECNIPFDIIIFTCQIISLCAFCFLCFRINIKEFIGITQIVRYFAGQYNDLGNVTNSGFLTGGFYKISRHPMYMTFILFIWLRAEMDLFYFVSALSVTAYLYTKTVFEERKLTVSFGQAYINYKKNTPRIFPWDRF